MSSHTFPYYEFSGASREIGMQHGRDAGDLIHRHLNMALGKLERKGVNRARARERAKIYVPYIERFAPHFSEELAGLAAGAELQIEDAYLLQLRAEVTDSPELESRSEVAANEREAIAHECTSFAISGELTSDGMAIAGQNADLPAGTRDLGIVARITPNDNPALLMLTPAGQISYIGINDAGMAVFANFLNTSGWRPGFPRYLLSRTALEHDSIRSAVDHLVTIPRASSRNLIIMERDGDAIDLEFSVERAARIEPENGVVAHSNHFVDPTMADEERAQGDRLANSCTRLDRMIYLLESERGRITPEKVMSFFRDRKNEPDAICRYFGDGPDDYMTFASVIGRPATGELWVAPGPPDHHEYIRYAFE